MQRAPRLRRMRSLARLVLHERAKPRRITQKMHERARSVPRFRRPIKRISRFKRKIRTSQSWRIGEFFLFFQVFSNSFFVFYRFWDKSRKSCWFQTRPDLLFIILEFQLILCAWCVQILLPSCKLPETLHVSAISRIKIFQTNQRKWNDFYLNTFIKKLFEGRVPLISSILT